MAHLRQEQRQALESAFRGIPPLDRGVEFRSFFELEGRRLAFWGVSEGYGTCSQIHNVNVAVLGDPDLGSAPIPHGLNIHYIFWLREADPDELSSYERQMGIKVMIVELLQVKEVNAQKVILSRSALKGRYVVRQM